MNLLQAVSVALIGSGLSLVVYSWGWLLWRVFVEPARAAGCDAEPPLRHTVHLKPTAALEAPSGCTVPLNQLSFDDRREAA